MPVSITTGGYILLVRNGVVLSQHREVKEALERAIAHAETAGPGDYTIRFPDWGVSVSLGSVSSRSHLSLQARLNFGMSTLRRVITGGTGTQSGTYTATHYVAPYTSVTGASGDTDVQTASAFANSNESNPCTFACALANATAGNKVQLAPGVYNGSSTGNRFIPSFAPANEGTAADPIVFFAKYPAAYNRGSTSLYTEVRKPTTTTTVNGFTVPASGACPVLGNNTQSDYIIFDGFYANEAEAYSAPNGGIFLAHAATGIEFRRCFIERGSGVLYYQAGHNGNPFYAESTINSKILDCVVTGYVLRASLPAIIHQNNSSIEVYNSTGWVVRNCYLENFGYGMFQKESDNQWSTEGTWEYNHLLNGKSAINVQQGTFVGRYNLIVGADEGIHGDGGPVTYTGGTRPPQILTFANNTIVMNSANFVAGAQKAGFIIETGMQLRTSTLTNNIVYGRTGWTGHHFRTNSGGSSSWTFADWTTMNGNNYFREDSSTLSFMDTAFATVTGIANWRTTTGHEATSITTDPLFVDVANSNFRLQGGSPASGKGCYVTGSEEIGLRANPTY